MPKQQSVSAGLSRVCQAVLAATYPTRSAAIRCRERWLNHLDPHVRKDKWSVEEESIFIEAHRRLGNSWCVTVNDQKMH